MHHWNYTSEDSWPYLSSSFQSLLPLFPLNIFKIDLQKKRSLINFYPNSIFSLPWIEQMLFFLSKISYQSYLINSWDLWGAFLGSKVTVPLIISSAALGKKKALVSKVISLSLIWGGRQHLTNGMLAFDLFTFRVSVKNRSKHSKANQWFLLSAPMSVCLSVCEHRQPRSKKAFPALPRQLHPSEELHVEPTV